MEWDWTRPIFDHVHLRVADLAHSKAFYATVLEPLGIPLLLDTGEAAQFANLAVSADGPVSERVHLAFMAGSREQVDAFHRAGIDARLHRQRRAWRAALRPAGHDVLRRIPARPGRQQRRGRAPGTAELVPDGSTGRSARRPRRSRS